MKHILIAIFLILSLITPCYAVQINSNQVDATIPTKSYVNGTDETQAAGIANRYTKAETNATIEAAIAAIPAASSDYVKIGEYSPSGSVSTYTISSIPSTYKILKLYINASTTESSGSVEECYIQFNSDGAANHYSYNTALDGSIQAAAFDKSYIWIGTIGSSYDNSASNIELIVNNSVSEQYKVCTASVNNVLLSGTAKRVLFCLIAGSYIDPSNAVSAITILTAGANFETSTKFILYGLK